jgi:tRNA(Ile)-lysidine synthetase-like protein
LPSAKLSRAGAQVAAVDGAIGVAFSGGADSLLLLELVQRYGRQAPVALHVHHGFGEGSDQAAEFCAAQARRLGVELRTARAEVHDRSRGIEAGARQVRRAALDELWPAPALLAIGTQRDDVIEGAWLRLLAGSSARFWSVPSAQDGRLIRPLIDMRRTEIRGLSPSALADPMNEDSRYDRVALRQSAVLDAIDPRGEVADAFARLGARVAALDGIESVLPLYDMPLALRRFAVRRQLARLQPGWRPRNRFVEEITLAAASDEKTRCFSMSGASVYLRSGHLVLKY